MSDNTVVFSVLAVNHPGTLLRVAGLFSRRGFNIDSIVACRTEQEAFSRLTLMVTGDEATFTQLIRQLLKLEDIVRVEKLEPAECAASEMLLIKVHAESGDRQRVLKAAQAYGSRVMDIGDTTMTMELTGQTEAVDRFVAHMERFGIAEMARSGIAALARGDQTLQ